MNILNVIHWPFLIGAFILGLLYIQYYHPERRDVMIYPKPDNVDKIQYQDKSGALFAYHAIPVNCDKTDITKYPVQ